MTGIIAQNVGRTSGLIKAASGGGGTWTLIKTLTASGDSTLSFVDGSSDVVLDSTYPIYLFKIINVHPSADNRDFDFNMSIDTGSNYNVTKTTTWWYNYHAEDGGIVAGVEYSTGTDIAQGTGFQEIMENVGGDNDQGGCGEIWLFNPSSTVFVKHFISTTQIASYGPYTKNAYIAGYANSTSAVDAVQFKFRADNIDAGKIKLYGLKDSA